MCKEQELQLVPKARRKRKKERKEPSEAFFHPIMAFTPLDAPISPSLPSPTIT
jgi:hypothetical protein